jgi:lipoate-protein ligase A
MFRESMGLEDPNGIYKALFQSLDEVEKKLGKSLKTSDPQYAQFEEAIEKKFSALLQANPEDLATQAEIADATEEAVRLKAEIGATQSRAS